MSNILSWGRLARLYKQRMYRLFSGQLWELIRNPNAVNDPVFQRAAYAVARAMVQEAAHANAKSWREAAMKSTRAREIYRALQAEIERHNLEPQLHRIARRNADLISSVPDDVARRITRYAAELHQKGLRPAAIEREIRRLTPGLVESKIELISRTELSRAESNLSEARSELVGIPVYQWLTSRDQRVRKSHKNLENVLVFWNDPPQPEELIGEHSSLGRGHAGCFPNCRCLSAPVVSLEEISWPAKVFRSDRITRMSRAQFIRIAPGYQRAA